ncbi:MAG: S8 family serine peptidase [Mycobacterium leprae]
MTPAWRRDRKKKGDGVVGVAPDARILNVKVGSADGGVDVTQVVAAVDWVVQHRRDNGMNVRVINLSYGTHSRLSYTSDPLAHAVDNAWRAGIVVVAAGGNDGTEASLTMPAADPQVLSVGAVDHRGTAGAADDGVAGFSNVGSPDRHLNVVAPGKSVVSLRLPGSYADRGHPEGLVPGEVSGRLFRGSGSSQAAAVVSGAAALLLQQRPRLTPNQVKWILGRSARALPGAAGRTATYDVLDLTSALRTATPSSATAAQDAAATRGDGALDLARGDGRIVDPDNGVALAGDVDALGTPWNGAHWAAASTARASWTGGTWNARSWSGDGWTAPSWAGPAWDAAAWTGVSWSGADWASRRWSSDAWVSRRWSGEDWASRRWSGDGWSSRRWRATTGPSAAAAGDAARRAR